MAKAKTVYVCQECGAKSPKWIGKCPSCNNWNSYQEEVEEKRPASVTAYQRFTSLNDGFESHPKKITDIETEQYARIDLKSEEINRLLGGGLVPGSVVLVGGEPGIGKSTLLLQMALTISNRVLYVSGEESPQQIKMRADRIQSVNPECFIFGENSLERIITEIKNIKPEIVIIDSVQTLQTDQLDSSAGSISQIRECAAVLTRIAKEAHIPFFLIGHINKEGQIAGPKVLEHVVDTVLQFEGERNYLYRILRSIKNRFGSTSEIGIFEMQGSGLREVTNPSELLLSEKDTEFSGIAIASSIEGMRPFLIEIQALVSTSVYGTPQRSSTGFDLRRLSMLLAVIEKRGGLRLSGKDVFLNIAGGIRVDDPGIDLAVVVAILSSDLDVIVPQDIAFAGEVGLSGEIRSVQRIEQRISEAHKLGYKRIFIPSNNFKSIKGKANQAGIFPVSRIEDVVKQIFR